MKDSKIKADATINTKPLAILGEYAGECADANITNKNGLDITRPVWEGVFASEEYNEGIKNGHYIGFLGHPEDPNCMDFEHGCIVMTEGHIDPDGKVQGRFNLVNTPVGQIVKTFIDAGVKFGISVRGAGDIVDNSVDPDTFVFRGFDLVAFPAYPNSIPTFTEIAASTDAVQQKKYQAVCAAVTSNLDSLNKAEVEVLQANFAKQSKEYAALENRKKVLAGEQVEVAPEATESAEATEATEAVVASQKLDAVTALYLGAQKKNKVLQSENIHLRKLMKTIKSAESRKIDSLNRITASQLKDMDQALADAASRTKKAVLSNQSLSKDLADVTKRLKSAEDANLKYSQKIEANTQIIREKDSIISKLQSNLSETVRKANDAEAKTSNCDAQIASLQRKIEAAQALVDEYQNAYAQIYANAIGVGLEHVSVTATTTVSELQQIIKGSSKYPSGAQEAILASAQVSEVGTDMDDSSLITL